MKQIKTRAGFSAVMVIIIVLLLAGLGVGGYFAYTQLILPGLNPYNKIIPEDLKAYDLGKNADGFLVYKLDKDLQSLYTQTGVNTEAEKVKAAIAYYSSQDQSAAVIIQFSSKDIADLAVKALNDQKASAKNEFSLMPEFKVDQKDSVMIVTLGKGLSAFQGTLSENPEISKIDQTMVDSQLIAYFNHAKSPESTLLLFAISNSIFSGFSDMDISMVNPENPIIPSAHAQAFIAPTDKPVKVAPASSGVGNLIKPTNQSEPTTAVSSGGFISPTDNPSAISNATGGTASPRMQAMTLFNGLLSFASDSIFIVRYKNQSLSAQLTTNIFDKNNISSSAVMKIAQMSGAKTGTEELEKAYDMMIESSDKLMPDIQKNLNGSDFKQFYPDSNATITFDHKSFSIGVNIAESDMKKIIDSVKIAQTEAPMKARNAARKADMNNLIAAIETYNADNNAYPENSMCIDQMADLQKYFISGKSPTDPQGKQTIGSFECTGGYYYQTFPGKQSGYMVWGKLENNLGNTNETPQTVAEKISDSSFHQTFKENKEGEYFVIDETSQLIETPLNDDVTSIPAEELGAPVIAPSVPAPPKVKRVK